MKNLMIAILIILQFPLSKVSSKYFHYNSYSKKGSTIGEVVCLSLLFGWVVYKMASQPHKTELKVDEKSFNYSVIDSAWGCTRRLQYELMLQLNSCSYVSQHFLDSVATIKYGYIDTSLTWNQELVPHRYDPFVWYLMASTDTKCIDSTLKYTNYKCEAVLRFHFEKGKDIKYEFLTGEIESADIYQMQVAIPGVDIEKRITWNQSVAPKDKSLLMYYSCKGYENIRAYIELTNPNRISP